jgi:hypothetical protein
MVVVPVLFPASYQYAIGGPYPCLAKSARHGGTPSYFRTSFLVRLRVIGLWSSF